MHTKPRLKMKLKIQTTSKKSQCCNVILTKTKQTKKRELKEPIRLKKKTFRKQEPIKTESSNRFPPALKII